MPRAFFSDSFNDIHELKYDQAEEKLEAGGDEKLIFNFIWPKGDKFDSTVQLPNFRSVVGRTRVL